MWTLNTEKVLWFTLNRLLLLKIAQKAFMLQVVLLGQIRVQSCVRIVIFIRANLLYGLVEVHMISRRLLGKIYGLYAPEKYFEHI
jgi:hypothetical protein